MNKKFDDIKKDSEITILFEVVAKFGCFDAKYEKWLSDGIYGESMIFYSSDIQNEDEQDLISEMKQSNLILENSSVTISRGDKYTFFNFNFKEV